MITGIVQGDVECSLCEREVDKAAIVADKETGIMICRICLIRMANALKALEAED